VPATNQKINTVTDDPFPVQLVGNLAQKMNSFDIGIKTHSQGLAHYKSDIAHE